MSLRTILEDLTTDLGTDYKVIWTQIFGGLTGTLADLTTTNKTSIVAAINEVKASATGAPPDATESAKGVVELATLAEVATGTDTSRAVTAAGVRQERNALKAEILGGVGPAFDTLNELYAEIQGNDADITALLTQISLKADADSVYTKAEIDTMLGDLSTLDLSAAYAAAKQ